jgi:penicillin-binding protein 2
MPTKSWKMGHFGTLWKPGETIVASIGQGYIQATPLQLAVMTARLVNGGYAVKPWLTHAHAPPAPERTAWPKMNFKQRHLDLIIRGMNKVVTHPDGTAYDARIRNAGFEMGGKTGTAQVRRITQAQRLEGYDMEDLPWKYRHHALFVGYAPVRAPRYVCAVVVEHGGSGSSAAAPIARDILKKTHQQAPDKIAFDKDEKSARMAAPDTKREG